MSAFSRSDYLSDMARARTNRIVERTVSGMLTIDDVIERFDGSLAYSTNSKEICQYIADLLKELKERRKAPEIVTCGECKHRDPEDKKCDCGHDIIWQLPRGDNWYCADAERRTDG